MTSTPSSSPTAAGGARRMGRPPRISRERIAEAADEIGLADLSVRAVADHLGVTTAAIYHHVDGRDDLLRLAAERSAGRLQVPVDRGQHWAEWLLEWARHTHDAFVDDPALLDRFLDGAISSETIVRSIEAILEVMVRQGFESEEALLAYRLVSTCALGRALGDVRDRRSLDAGRTPPGAQIRSLADTTGAGATAGPAEAPAAADGGDATSQFRAVILGIAVLRGDDLAETAAVLAGVRPRSVPSDPG